MTITEFINTDEEPLRDSIYGDGYRCSAYMKDGLFLPCVIIKKSKYMVDHACKRFEEEKSGKSIINWGSKDGYREIVKSFVTKGNCVNDYDIETVEKSRFAIPFSLLNQIHGETSMAWTAFVLKMKDGNMFSYGTTFLFSFFDLPDGYNFQDVIEVHNHSFVSEEGKLIAIRGHAENKFDFNPDRHNHKQSKIYRERPYFVCYID